MYTEQGRYTPSLIDDQWMNKIISVKKSGALDGISIIENKTPDHERYMGFLHEKSLLPPNQNSFLADSLMDVGVGVLPPGVPFPFDIPGNSANGNEFTVIIFGEITYSDIYREVIT